MKSSKILPFELLYWICFIWNTNKKNALPQANLNSKQHRYKCHITKQYALDSRSVDGSLRRECELGIHRSRLYIRACATLASTGCRQRRSQPPTPTLILLRRTTDFMITLILLIHLYIVFEFAYILHSIFSDNCFSSSTSLWSGRLSVTHITIRISFWHWYFYNV